MRATECTFLRVAVCTGLPAPSLRSVDRISVFDCVRDLL